MIKLSIAKIVLCSLLICLLCYGWAVALTSDVRAKAKQEKLVLEAKKYVEDEIYQEAINKLKQAVIYNTQKTETIMKYLADVYLTMNYKSDYLETLLRIIRRDTKNADIYYEAAVYLYDNYKYSESIEMLKQGIDKLESKKLKDFYEQIRFKTYDFYKKFDYVQSFKNGIAPVCKNQKWGYLSSKNNLIIEYKFNKASHFDNNIALVINNGKTAFIRKNGFNFKVANFKAKDILGINQDRAGVNINNEWHFIDSEFNITKEKWNNLGQYYNNIVAIEKNNLWGFRDIYGNILIDCMYNDIALNHFKQGFINGVNFVRKEDCYQLININNEVVTQNHWSRAKAFNCIDGYAAVEKNNKWGFVDSQGIEKIPFVWDEAKSFSYGLAAVKVNNKWGFINSSGDVVIGVIYEDVKSFTEGIAAVRINNKWTFIGLEEYRAPSNLIFDNIGN